MFIILNRCSPTLLALDSYIGPNDSASQVTAVEECTICAVITGNTFFKTSSQKPKGESAWI